MLISLHLRKAGLVSLALRFSFPYLRAGEQSLTVTPIQNPSHRRTTPATWRSAWHWLGLVLVTGLFCGLSALAYRLLAPTPTLGGMSPSPSNRGSLTTISPPSTSDTCAVTSRRVSLGGSVSPLDADGWVVELWLFGDQANMISQTDGLDELLPSREGSRRVASPELLVGEGLDDSVTITSLAPPLIGASSLSFTFGTGYTRYYFAPDSRGQFLRLAAQLSRATQASAGALFARCLRGGPPQLGAWFFGSNVGGVVGALVAAMLVEPPSLDLAPLGRNHDAKGRRLALAALSHQWRAKDPPSLARAVAVEGGLVTTAPEDGWLTVTFPFSDGNRATRSAQGLARTAKLTETVGGRAGS